ncbi:MAG: hypothetical protein LC798_19835 [Chloroflexi bacterium]|nr:hypothetical protein [Chloroflexota bacterium]
MTERPDFDPSRNITLVALRSAWQEARDERDMPDPLDVITDAVDRDGTVTRVRSLSWEEVLVRVVRDCEGTVE